MDRSQIPGFKTLLMGPSGTGKTTALRTLLNHMRVVAIFTEPSFEVVADQPEGKLLWTYIPPTASDFGDMIQMAEKVRDLPYESLKSYRDPKKREHTQWIDVLRALNDFTDSRTGEHIGMVDDLSTGTALWVDSLSGLSVMARSLQVGSNPTMDQKDYQVSMQLIETLLQRLCTNLHCPVIVCAHVEKELDETGGGSKIMASTLGRKLAPKIPIWFSDVILTRREGQKDKVNFSWTTVDPQADTKARNLPYADNLRPDFGQIIEKWKSRGGIIEPN